MIYEVNDCKKRNCFRNTFNPRALEKRLINTGIDKTIFDDTTNSKHNLHASTQVGGLRSCVN